MAEKTGIAWTDSTFNPWIGCEAISPGCDNCYAAAYAKRVGRDFAKRTRTSLAYWKEPFKWNAKAKASGKPWLVFCASLADVFDNAVPVQWRADLLALIERTPYLTWLLLTKRVGNVVDMLDDVVELTHGEGWQSMWTQGEPPANVWLGATIVNQKEADRDVPKLLATPAAVRFISYEPALGPVDWTKFPGIDWIIVGGESVQGSKARPFDITAARNTIAQCRQIGAAPFVKQLGSTPIWSHLIGSSPAVDTLRFKDRAGADPAEWPEDLRVQEFPA